MPRKTLATLLCAAALTASASTPVWLEADSAAAIEARTRADFPYTTDQFLEMARQKYPDFTRDTLDRYIDLKYVETHPFGPDGELRVFKKAMGNMALMSPYLHEGPVGRNKGASKARIAYVDSVIAATDGTNPAGAGHRVTYSFSVEVPYDPALAGDTLRLWLPLPMESARQSNIHILSASPQQYILSDGRSAHNTIYFEQPAPTAPDSPARFEYTAVFDTYGQYFSPDSIRARIRPYDKTSELYRRYTAVEEPHMVRMDSLARAIVGPLTDPYEQSEAVYQWISDRYPWAGAREYSTIECIPAYVLESGHGDCGQVSLLYISLMRSLGVPARWESGWMLHPVEINYHDWAEVYFEGVGWVPVDVSFGRYPNASDPRARKFYSTGMDSHRLASNLGVCDALYPPKRFVRSETVDFQAGELECSRGNIFYPGWRKSFRVISSTPITDTRK